MFVSSSMYWGLSQAQACLTETAGPTQCLAHKSCSKSVCACLIILDLLSGMYKDIMHVPIWAHVPVTANKVNGKGTNPYGDFLLDLSYRAFALKLPHPNPILSDSKLSILIIIPRSSQLKGMVKSTQMAYPNCLKKKTKKRSQPLRVWMAPTIIKYIKRHWFTKCSNYFLFAIYYSLYTGHWHFISILSSAL